MNKQKLLERLAAIASEADDLIVEQRNLSDGPDDEFDADTYDANSERLEKLREEKIDIDGKLARLARNEELATHRENLVAGVAQDVRLNMNRDPFDLDDLRWNTPISELRGRARAAIDQLGSHVDDAAREAVARKVDRMADPRGVVPNLVLRTGSEAYQRAFHKAMAGRTDLWTHEERVAVESTEEYRAALSLTDANGGYAVPFFLDPTLILTNVGTANPVRQLARVETITTDTWNGLTSAGVTAQWLAENTEAADASPTFSQPSIAAEKAAAFVQGSIEISQDYRNVQADIAMMIADAKDRLEGTAFIAGAGSGSNQPEGIITALDGGASEVSPATAETFAVADVYAVQQALPPRWRGRNPAWVAEVSTINAIRQFGESDVQHAFLTDLAGGQPPVMLGHRLYESSDMDAYADINVGATADNHILLYGDFKQYLIADRVGLSLEFIPHLFSTANNLPSGTRGWFAYWRVGGGVLVDDAFRVLNVATTL